MSNPGLQEIELEESGKPKQPGDFSSLGDPNQGQAPGQGAPNADGQPQYNPDGQQQMAAYPNQVPDEVAQQVKQDQAAAQKETVLDNIPGLRGDKDRQGFIIKTYSLILVMLGTTGAWCYVTYNTPGIQSFVLGNIWLYYVTLVIVIGLSCSLSYKDGYQRVQKSPGSYIFLACYTITHSYLIAVIILFYKVETIYQAAATTGGMFVVLTMYAVYVKGDLQMMGAGIVAGMNSLIWLILFQFIWGANKLLYLIIAVLVVILMALFIVYDTRLIVGGSHTKFSLDLDDYAIGAVILYSDIITMFIYLLQIFGGGNN